MTLQEAATLHEGCFLAATLGGILIARAMPDGRFTVLHNLARPPDARMGCLPYPTWQPTTPAARLAPVTTKSVWLLHLHCFLLLPLSAELVSCLSAVRN